MTLPKKSARVNRPAKQFMNHGTTAESSALVRAAETAAVRVGPVAIPAPLALEDAIPTTFSFNGSSDMLKFRLSMIFEAYQRNWNDVETHHQAMAERLRQSLGPVVSAPVLDLKLLSLNSVFARAQSALNLRLRSELQQEISVWAHTMKPGFTDAAQRILRVWYITHMHNPYPTEEEKKLLAFKAGISVKQVNTWFGNHRGRTKRKIIDLQQYHHEQHPQIKVKVEEEETDDVPRARGQKRKRSTSSSTDLNARE